MPCCERLNLLESAALQGAPWRSSNRVAAPFHKTESPTLRGPHALPSRSLSTLALFWWRAQNVLIVWAVVGAVFLYLFVAAPAPWPHLREPGMRRAGLRATIKQFLWCAVKTCMAAILKVCDSRTLTPLHGVTAVPSLTLLKRPALHSHRCPSGSESSFRSRFARQIDVGRGRTSKSPAAARAGFNPGDFKCKSRLVVRGLYFMFFQHGRLYGNPTGWVLHTYRDMLSMLGDDPSRDLRKFP